MIKLNTSLTCLIDLQVPEAVSVDRLIQRGKVSGRSDDNEAVIRNRLYEYNEKTVPVIRKYNELHGVTKIDGMGTFDAVLSKASAAMEEGSACADWLCIY